MSEDIFDAIIVGAGLAGSVAALVLAREGAQVLVIERGNSAGAKNVTGGRLYAHSLEHIIPGFADSAPVERLITHEKLAFMTEKSAMTMDYCNGDETSPSQRSYSVLRSKFDAWLMEQAEEAGAQLITGIRVDNLVQRDGKVVGVEADGDVIEAKTVILADGVNSILAEKLGMAKRVKPTDVAVGVKELIELPKSVIEDRFQLQGNQGAACLFAGSPTDGLMGGGFLYTNENTLSLGLVCGLHHLHDAKKSVPQMLEDFKDEAMEKFASNITGRQNAGKYMHTTKFWNPEANNFEGWTVEPLDKKIKDYVDAQIKISNKADAAATSGFGLDPVLSNLIIENKLSSGSEKLYSLKVYNASETAIPDMILCKPLQQYINANFPGTTTKVGLYRTIVEAEQNVSPSNRMKENA